MRCVISSPLCSRSCRRATIASAIAELPAELVQQVRRVDVVLRRFLETAEEVHLRSARLEASPKVLLRKSSCGVLRGSAAGGSTCSAARSASAVGMAGLGRCRLRGRAHRARAARAPPPRARRPAWARRGLRRRLRRGGFGLDHGLGLLDALALDAGLLGPFGDERAQPLRQRAHDLLEQRQVAGRDVVEGVAVQGESQCRPRCTPPAARARSRPPAPRSRTPRPDRPRRSSARRSRAARGPRPSCRAHRRCRPPGRWHRPP